MRQKKEATSFSLGERELMPQGRGPAGGPDPLPPLLPSPATGEDDGTARCRKRQQESRLGLPFCLCAYVPLWARTTARRTRLVEPAPVY